MRWTRTMTTLLLAAALASPAMAQEGRDQAKGHGEMGAGRHGMMMGMDMAPDQMSEMLAAHAEQLGLNDEQTARLEALGERHSAEMERHHAEMHAIHEAAMEILTPEQRERIHAMMHEGGGMMGHGGGHGEMKAHGRKPIDDPDADEDPDMEDEPDR